MAGSIPTRQFGKHDEQVSLLCVGGAHLAQPKCSEETAIRIVHACMDAGATFMDNAWEYNDGESERRMGKALAMDGRRKDAFLMTKDCAHDRKANHSMWKLEDSLRRLQTDYLDLWQLHEVVWEDDVDWIFAPGGSAEALLKAKEKGLVRYIGFTGHKDPNIHKRMLSQGFPFDAVQMPLNVLDAHYKSFEQEIVPICQEQGIAVIGMKSFASGDVFKNRRIRHPGRGVGLCHEPAGGNRGLGYGQHRGDESEPGDRARFRAVHGRAARRAAGPHRTACDRRARALQNDL